MALRKNKLMYRFFGVNTGHICGECNNFHLYNYRGKTYRKCQVYGVTHSEASDWAKKYYACGMFNKEYNNKPIITLVHCCIKKETIKPIEGQLTMEILKLQS